MVTFPLSLVSKALRLMSYHKNTVAVINKTLAQDAAIGKRSVCLQTIETNDEKFRRMLSFNLSR